VASTIIGVTSLAQLDEDLDAWGTHCLLSPEVLAAIDRIRWELRDPANRPPCCAAKRHMGSAPHGLAINCIAKYHVSETPATACCSRRTRWRSPSTRTSTWSTAARSTAPRCWAGPVHAVVKTLVMQDQDAKPLLVLMHGNRKVSTKNLARQIGAKSVEPCKPEVANRHSGYLVGGTSPFGTRRAMPVYIEETILELPRILINGGRRGYLVGLDPQVCVQLLGAAGAVRAGRIAGTALPETACWKPTPFIAPLAPVLAYLLGSLSFAVIVSRVMGLKRPAHLWQQEPRRHQCAALGQQGGRHRHAAARRLKGWLPVVLVRWLGKPYGMEDGTWRWWGWRRFWATCGRCSSASRAARAWPRLPGRGVRRGPGAGPGTALTWLIIAYFFRYSSLASLVAAAFAPVYYLMGDRLQWYVESPSCWPVCHGAAAGLCGTAKTSTGCCKARNPNWEPKNEQSSVFMWAPA
jgi:Cys-tRNA(Pro) deacylase